MLANEKWMISLGIPVSRQQEDTKGEVYNIDQYRKNKENTIISADVRHRIEKTSGKVIHLF